MVPFAVGNRFYYLPRDHGGQWCYRRIVRKIQRLGEIWLSAARVERKFHKDRRCARRADPPPQRQQHPRREPSAA